MKILNRGEILQMALCLAMSEQEAQEVADIFVNIYTDERDDQRWKVESPLANVDDYIKEWENHWHRESNFEEYYKYEKENCYYDYSEPEECFSSLESFKKRTTDYHYELSNGLIIVVC